jgi:hypothetical protein
MNIESIPAHLALGAEVTEGQKLGRTGCTWNGAQSQSHDPHLHLGLEVDGARLSPFPALVASYFRTYDDPLIPIAGGMGYAVAGEMYTCDGTRSLARAGRKIVSYRWRLHDGAEVEGPLAEVPCDHPGLYAEELTVVADDGSEDRDYLHIRVWDPARERDIARGWLHYTPSRQIAPGDEVLFWNRTRDTRGAKIDFGDGTAPESIEAEARHACRAPGLYTATLSALGPADEPAALKVRVIVRDFARCGGRV